MRPPVDTICAPPVPRRLRRLRPPGERDDDDAAPRAQVVWFWDVCQPASLRALSHLVAWHERYAADGLRILAVHAPGSEPGRDEDAVAAAVGELGLPFEVALDTGFDLWRAYENPGWPARYVLAPGLRVVDVHFGEGDYEGAERAIRELLGASGPSVEPLLAAERDDARVVVPTPDAPGPYAGPYAAGEVWIVVDRPGAVRVDGDRIELARMGAHRVVANAAHAEGRVAIEPEGDLRVLATAFAPGAEPPGSDQ